MLAVLPQQAGMSCEDHEAESFGPRIPHTSDNNPLVSDSHNSGTSKDVHGEFMLPLTHSTMASEPSESSHSVLCSAPLKQFLAQAEQDQQAGSEAETNLSDDSKSKGTRKRERAPYTQGEGYRERWTKKQPRRIGKTWMSDVCSACEQPSEGMLVCMGPCLRAFHHWCLGISDDELQQIDTSKWFCPECDSGIMRCFVCGEFGAGHNDPFVRKCSLGSCGRFYHLKCVDSLKFTRSAAKGQHFYCPQHYCVACGKSGDGVDMVKCIRCPNAYHSSCTSKNGTVKKLKQGTKVILCAAHQGELPRNYVQPPPPSAVRLKKVIDEARAQGIPVGKERRSRNVEPVQPFGTHHSMVLPPRYAGHIAERGLQQPAHRPYPPKGYAPAPATHLDPFAPRSGVLPTHQIAVTEKRNVRPRLMASSGKLPSSASSVSSSPWPEQVPSIRGAALQRSGSDTLVRAGPGFGAVDPRQMRRSSSCYLPGGSCTSQQAQLERPPSQGSLRSAHSAPVNSLPFVPIDSRSMSLDDPTCMMEHAPRVRTLHRLASHPNRMPIEQSSAQPMTQQQHQQDRRYVPQSHPHQHRYHHDMPLSIPAMEDKVAGNNGMFRVVSARDPNTTMMQSESIGGYINSVGQYMEPVKVLVSDFGECSSSFKHERKDVSSVTINVGTDSCFFDSDGHPVALSRPMVMRSVSDNRMSCYGDMFLPPSSSHGRQQPARRGGAPEGATGALPPHTSSLSLKAFPSIERSESSMNASTMSQSSLLHQSWEHLSAGGQSSVSGSPGMQQGSTAGSHLNATLPSPSNELPDPAELSQSFISPHSMGPSDLAGFEEFVESMTRGHTSDCQQMPLDGGYMDLEHDVFNGLPDHKPPVSLAGADLLEMYPL